MARVEQIHPGNVFSEYRDMFKPVENISTIKPRWILVDTPVKVIKKTYRKADNSGVSWLKVINPLNLVLSAVKSSRAIIFMSANKIPYKAPRNIIIFALCTPLFIVDNFLDLFNRTPTQLYKRYLDRKKSTQAIELEEKKPLLTPRPSDEPKYRETLTNKATLTFKIELSEATKDQLKRLAEECAFTPINIEAIKNCLNEIRKDPAYLKYRNDYRKEQQYLNDRASVNRKDAPIPHSNLNKSQIDALAIIFTLEEALVAKQKVFTGINQTRLEKMFDTVRRNTVLQDFDSTSTPDDVSSLKKA